MSGRDNLILPFFLRSGSSRGVLVRAGRAVTDTLKDHDYPANVARLLAESMTLGIALASQLKYEGLFTLQVRGDGPVRALVVDVTSAGMVRGVARFDRDTVPVDPEASLTDLTGSGFLTFTVDQGTNMEPYQGIVALRGQTVAECALSYIDQSEQVPTLLMIAAVPPGPDEDEWRASALLVQKMPGDDAQSEEAWQTAKALMGTLSQAELLDMDLPPEQLLWRLFHEEEIGTGDLRALFYGCRCSPEKVLRTLASLPKEEQAEFAEMGVIDVACDFCNTHYNFTPQELDAYRDSLEKKSESEGE